MDGEKYYPSETKQLFQPIIPRPLQQPSIWEDRPPQQPNITINLVVPPEAIRVVIEQAAQPAPIVNVNVPDIVFPDIPAPVVNVIVPEQPAPIVNVEVPRQQRPVVNIEVPEQPAPIVNVETLLRSWGTGPRHRRGFPDHLSNQKSPGQSFAGKRKRASLLL